MYDFFFAVLAVVVSTKTIMDTVGFVSQETISQSFNLLGSDEAHKSPDSEIESRRVYVLATGEIGAFPTPLQVFPDVANSLEADLTSGA